jgi:GAF domain-containing protein
VRFTELLATAIANAESRAGLARLAEEQAGSRRVAMLVARGAPPEEVFAAVTEEVGQLLPVDYAALGRYESGGMLACVAARSRTGDPFPPVGTRAILGGKNVSTIVFETARAARIDNYSNSSGPLAVAAGEEGIRSSVATPIIVEGRLRGVMPRTQRWTNRCPRALTLASPTSRSCCRRRSPTRRVAPS